MFSLISSFSWIISRSGWFWRAKLKKRLLVPSHVYGTAVGTCKPLSASEIRGFYYPLADFIVMKWQWTIEKRSFMPAGVMSPRLKLHEVSKAISRLYHLGQKLHSGVIPHPGWDGLCWIQTYLWWSRGNSLKGSRAGLAELENPTNLCISAVTTQSNPGRSWSDLTELQNEC